jgi:hypothetical protein
MTIGWFNIINKNIRDMYRGLQGFKKGYQQRTWLPMIRVLGLTIPTIFWNRQAITSVSLLSEELMTLLAMNKYSSVTQTRIYVSKYEYAWNGEDWSQDTDQISAETIWCGNKTVCSEINKLINSADPARSLLSKTQEILNIIWITINTVTNRQTVKSRWVLLTLAAQMSCACIASSMPYNKISIKGLQYHFFYILLATFILSTS